MLVLLLPIIVSHYHVSLFDFFYHHQTLIYILFLKKTNMGKGNFVINLAVTIKITIYNFCYGRVQYCTVYNAIHT